MNMVIKRLSRKILFACCLPLLPFLAFAQENSDGVSSSSEPQVEMLEEDDVQIEIAEVGGVLKICGVSFGVNSKNVHKAVVLDVACPTESPELIKMITKELFGCGSNDIKKACRDYLSDVQTGKVKVDIDSPLLAISCICVCYQKGRVFSCLINRAEVNIKSKLKQVKLKGWIYDLTKGKKLTLEDVFETEWLSKHAKEINHDKVVFLNSDLNVLVDGSINSPFVLKKMKKNLRPEFVTLIDWQEKPLFFTSANFDYRQLIKDVGMMNK